MRICFVPVTLEFKLPPLFLIVPTFAYYTPFVVATLLILVFSDHHWLTSNLPWLECSNESISRTLELLEGDIGVEPIGTVVKACVAKLEEILMMLLSAFLIPLFTLIILRPR